MTSHHRPDEFLVKVGNPSTYQWEYWIVSTNALLIATISQRFPADYVKILERLKGLESFS